MSPRHSTRTLKMAIMSLACLLLLGGCAEFDPALIEEMLGSAAQQQRPLDEPTVAQGRWE